MLRSIVLLAAMLVSASAYGGGLPSATPKGLSGSAWSSIRAQYQRHRQAAFPENGGYRARNYAQQWVIRFDGRGFDVTPDAGGWRWGLELQSYGFPGQEHGVKHARADADVEKLSYQWDSLMTEWFVNDGRGLEHGFTLASRPGNSDSALTLHLAVRGTLTPRISSDGRWVGFLDDRGMAALNYAGLKVTDAQGRELAARFTREPAGLRLEVDEIGARYPITIDPIAQQAYLKPAAVGSTQASDWFGYSVSVSGDTVVVGAPREFSSSLGINSTPNELAGGPAGAAYVFVRIGGVWSQQAYLKPAAVGTGQAGDQFGWSVAISGDTVVVGAPEEDSNTTGVNSTPAEGASDSGAAYVFIRSGGVWSQQAYLKPPVVGVTAGFAGYEFGWSVAIGGDTLAVGAYDEASSSTGINSSPNSLAPGAGSAYVFARTGGVWSQQAYLKPAAVGTTQANDHFGAAIAVSGDTVVVGAFQEDSSSTGINSTPNEVAGGAGAAYVYFRTAGVWSQEAYLKPAQVGPQGQAGDFFGASVAVSGDTVAVGANHEASSTTGINTTPNEAAGSSGAVYVFTRSAGVWSQQAYVKPAAVGTTQVGDDFGISVGLSGDTMVVGAFGEDSSTTGINTSANELSAIAGAAYVFTRSAGVWSQQAYLKPAAVGSTQAGDSFGWSVAVSGDTAVVGAYLEDSSTLGINTTPNEGSGDSGTAYVIAGVGNSPSVTITSSPSGLLFNSSGSGCSPGTGYTTPEILFWIPGSSCSISVSTSQTGPGNVQYNFNRWEDNSTNATRAITAPSVSATYTAIFAPASGSQPIGVGPSSGNAGRQLFSFVSRHGSGANSIQYAQFLFTKSGLSALNACYISYDPTANVFYLLNDDLTQWYGLLGGSPNTIGNAQCTIYGGTSGSTKAGTDLTTNVDISFRSGFSGLKTIYQFSGDTSAGTSGWQTMGTWNDTGDPSAVEVISLTPNSGNGASQVFTSVVNDGDGANTIAFVQLVMNAGLSGFNGCFIHYDRASNVFYLLNDGGTVFAGLVAGSGQVSNSQCTLKGAGSGGIVAGSTLTITYNLDLSAGFAGAKKVFMQPVDNSGVIEVWHQIGTWTR